MDFAKKFGALAARISQLAEPFRLVGRVADKAGADALDQWSNRLVDDNSEETHKENGRPDGAVTSPGHCVPT